ncbi:MAG: DUF4199 domain-containing protein [Sphingobacteriales bacterium]|nr:MAG: DUF4199 domain-containing protein [Sphingobacteriales bacterium]
METKEIPVNRFDIPVKYGLIIGLVMALVVTIQYQFFSESWWGITTFGVFSFIVNMALYFVTGVQQRKAFGGYIDIKQAFSALFVTILISLVISFIYSYIYVEFIDPDVIDRISNTSIGFAEKMGAPQEQLDKIQAQVEEQKENAHGIGKQLLGFLSQVVIYSIFGFIIAAIVKRKRPEFTA